MATIFLISLIVGGGLLAVSMFAGDADMDTDLDLDVDLDAGLDGDFDGGDPHGFRLLSLRAVSYFLFGAGAAGTAMLYLSDSSVLVATGVALVVGLALAFLVDGVFRYLKRTESGGTTPESKYVGLSARVTIPFRPGGSGKVLVTRGSRTQELVARPYDPDATAVEEWTDVLIVAMDQGQALVAPAGRGGVPTSN
jgi:hypothetical protein